MILFQEACPASTYPSHYMLPQWRLAIYRWARLLQDTPTGHPLHIIMCQRFFALFLERRALCEDEHPGYVFGLTLMASSAQRLGGQWACTMIWSLYSLDKVLTLILTLIIIGKYMYREFPHVYREEYILRYVQTYMEPIPLKLELSSIIGSFSVSMHQHTCTTNRRSENFLCELKFLWLICLMLACQHVVVYALPCLLCTCLRACVVILQHSASRAGSAIL